MKSVLLAYAFNAESKVVHIDDVKNGLECGCTCPECGESLIAKNDGKIREHHFAHVSGTDCGKGYQTLRHIWAKELLLENGVIPVSINGIKNFWKTNKIGMEVKLADLNIIPDVLAEITVPLKIYGVPVSYTGLGIAEIYVTHKVGDEKSEIIRKAGIPAVEIDLSKSTATTKEALVNDFNNKENWKVINDVNNPQLQTKIWNDIRNIVRLPNVAYCYSNGMSSRNYKSRRRTSYGCYRKRGRTL